MKTENILIAARQSGKTWTNLLLHFQRNGVSLTDEEIQALMSGDPYIVKNGKIEVIPKERVFKD